MKLFRKRDQNIKRLRDETSLFDPDLVIQILASLDELDALDAPAAAEVTLNRYGKGFACRFIVGSWLLMNHSFAAALHHFSVAYLTCPDDDFYKSYLKQHIVLACVATEDDATAVELLANKITIYAKPDVQDDDYWASVLRFVREKGICQVQ